MNSGPDEPGRSTELAFSGALDMATADSLREAMQQALRSPDCDVLVVDLAKVDFIDSTGIGALVAARNLAIETGKTLRLNPVSDRVRRALSITTLDTVFDLGHA